MAKPLQSPNKYQIQPQCFGLAKPIKITNIITRPNKGIIANNFILNPQKAPHNTKHITTIIFREKIFQSFHHKITNL